MMNNNSERTCRVLLQPACAEIFARVGTPMRDILFEQGVEFPCGGQGKCLGCKVRILQGNMPATPEEEELLSSEDLDAGWRLACKSILQDDLVLELRNWQTSVLSNDTEFHFTPGDGLGIAIDLGTTTLALQLLDLMTGDILAVRTALNPQARFGSDVMSRVQYAVDQNGAEELMTCIREQLGSMAKDALESVHADTALLKRVLLVGNTVMHHLFCGLDVEPMSHSPFESPHDNLQIFSVKDIKWDELGNPQIYFLPGLGSFVGSDVLAGVLATNLHKSDTPIGLVDLGTNGEIVIGNKERILCASTAAGPAFEGAKIWMGMRASTGAIWKVTPHADQFICEVIGNTPPRGICGSGLVDAAAAGLEMGMIKPTGRFSSKADTLPLMEHVELTQGDIRQLQLAKGAIAAGIRILLQRWGAEMDDLTRFSLAGAFGNYINRGSARRIGLIQAPLEKVEPVGNSALLGAKMALFSVPEELNFKAIRSITTHFSLNEDPQFQDVFVDEMSFPAGK